MKQLFFIAFAFIFSSILSAQGIEKHVVFIKDKNNNPFSLTNPSAFLTQRSLARRTRGGISLDMKDLPVTPSYVTQIAATGATVYYSLKWFNAVVVATSNPSVLSALASLPFVDHIDQVSKKNPVRSPGQPGMMEVAGIPPYTISMPANPLVASSAATLNYGQAFNQTHMISLDALHNLGYTGAGMMIAQLDAGWYHVDQIAAFDSLWHNNQILGTRDFEVPGNNVFGDFMNSHGTSVLSTMGANLPGQMVGTAPQATYWLLRTEDADIEVLTEEYNWAAGAEFADSVGADVINSSLGYTTFDNPVYNHSWADLNGNTAPCSRAAGLASSRGILVVNAAGNSGGGSWQYVGIPADNDSVLSIGAVDGQGFYAPFSSTGPTADGRVKPDVSAEGSGTAVVGQGGGVGSGYGTSFASPIMAGAMACLWQSALSYTAEQLRNAIRSSASQASAPDSLLGYGIPNMMNAHLLLSVNPVSPAGKEIFSLSPVPVSTFTWLRTLLNTRDEVRVDILSVTGQVLHTQRTGISSASPVRLDEFNRLPGGIYFVKITGNSGQQLLRAVKL
ncbi:MAG: S8 family peptidase [Bacteroidota bacterium]